MLDDKVLLTVRVQYISEICAVQFFFTLLCLRTWLCLETGDGGYITLYAIVVTKSASVLLLLIVPSFSHLPLQVM